jgi:hypothetical protein
VGKFFPFVLIITVSVLLILIFTISGKGDALSWVSDQINSQQDKSNTELAKKIIDEQSRLSHLGLSIIAICVSIVFYGFFLVMIICPIKETDLNNTAKDKPKDEVLKE